MAATIRPFLRAMAASDLAAAHALTSEVRWPYRLADWEFAFRLGRGVVAEIDGSVVGVGLCWFYGERQAVLGMVVISPSLQRQGLGRRIVEALLDLCADRSVLLHATNAAIPLYASFGFRGDAVIRQYQGAATQAGLHPLPAGERLRPVGRSDPAILAALDREATGMDRPEVVRAVLEAGSGVVLDREGEPLGFAVLRRFGHGHVIGPVIAPDAHRARAMIAHFFNLQAGQFVRIDVPDATGLCPWLAQFELHDAGPATRMVLGDDIVEPAGGTALFALVSQSLG